MSSTDSVSAAGSGSSIAVLGQRDRREKLGQPAPALAGADEALPVRYRQFHRCERARRQDRARDDDAGGGLLVDDEIGADRQHRRLEHHAQDFATERRTRRQGRWRDPALADSWRWRWPQRCGQRGPCPSRPAPRRCARWLRRARCASADGRHALVGPRTMRSVRIVSARSSSAADERRDADPGMERKADRQVERHPRQIE